MKTIFEETGGTYTMQGDYCLPDLKLTEKENKPIGIWEQRHQRYLKQYHRGRYYNLLTSGKLDEYLADIEERAEDMFFRLVKELSEKEGVTERLKANDPLAWVQRMNNIRNRAAEIVNAEIIFT